MGEHLQFSLWIKVLMVGRGSYSWRKTLKRSTFMFLFLTEHFCLDSWAELQKDECLMESLENPNKRWCVVPVHTKPRSEADYTIPIGLRPLKGVHIYEMFRKKKKLGDIDVDELTLADFEPSFLNNMKKMFNSQISLKIERERSQLQAFDKWKRKRQHEKMDRRTIQRGSCFIRTKKI